MTSDAKVGLLLGLVFIIIIAFVINGLPNFFKQTDSESAAIRTSITNFSSGSVGLSDQADEVVKAINGFENYQAPRNNNELENQVQDVRYTNDLGNKTNVEKIQANQVMARAKVKTYLVQDGDNLAVIAKKVYGSEQGNKIDVIEKIFQANSGILESRDEVFVGQKLIIPLLSELKKAQSEEELISTGMFEKVKAVASRNFSALKNVVSKTKTAKYVVKRDDTLWKIATQIFGNGSRYHEIFKLNRDIIRNADDIAVGTCLSLPRR